MAAKLSTHILDIMNGCPAAGMSVELWEIHGTERRLLRHAMTNSDGRTDAPLLSGEEVVCGEYELLFYVGDYFRGKLNSPPTPLFLERVPVRFHINDSLAAYHVPLLCSPWAYSTYRGS